MVILDIYNQSISGIGDCFITNTLTSYERLQKETLRGRCIWLY